MNRLLILALGAAVAVGACATSASDADDIPLRGEGAAAQAAPAAPAFENVTIPAGTVLPLSLTAALGSEAGAVDDAVDAQLTRAVTIGGREVLPAGARLAGVVTSVERSSRVAGRATLAFRFTSINTGGRNYDLQTEPVSYRADATKGEDAATIGVAAGIGAAVGAAVGGAQGAATGAAVGGGAGTGVVLATRGDEVSLATGTGVTTQLTAPLTVRVPIT